MNIARTISKNEVLIRLTEERWKHIVLMHPSLVDKQNKVLATVKNPDYILKGGARDYWQFLLFPKEPILW